MEDEKKYLRNNYIIETLLKLDFLGQVEVTHVEIKAQFKGKKLNKENLESLLICSRHFYGEEEFYISNDRVVFKKHK